MAGRARGMRGAALLVAAALACGACDVRWESDPSPAPSPDATTLARDTLAVAEQTVLDAARAEGDSEAEAAASAHLDALGGVYVAFPDAPPTASPSPAAPPPLDDAIAAARVAARDAESDADANLASLATSIDLGWALHVAAREAGAAAGGRDGATADATADATAPSDPTVGTPLPDPAEGDAFDGFDPGPSTSLTADDLAALALAHDEARFAYETAAAQYFAQDRAWALATADWHAARGDALAEGLDEDPRTPLYQLRGVDLLDPEARSGLLEGLELDLAARYAALAVAASSDDRPWLLNGAYDAYVRVLASGTAADLPALPGLRVG